MSTLFKEIDMRLGQIRGAFQVSALVKELITVFRNISLAYSKIFNEIEGRTVTFSTNMNTDVAGRLRELVYCSSDSKIYVCTKTGKAGHATWSTWM